MSQDIISKIQLLYEQGLEPQARELERRHREQNQDWKTAHGSVETEVWLKKFITKHPKMLELKNDVRKCSLVDDPVLIIGETGTGKELIARALHGGRKGKFLAINITNLPSELLESELFGHIRGSFTGAVVDKPGLFQTANDGTIFLDEIGDMPLDMQSKLLRALQDRKARRLGSNEDYEFNARVVSATNQKLFGNGHIFRKDLYYRLSVLELHTLPLRERLEDVELIVQSLCPEFPKDFVWYKKELSGLDENNRFNLVKCEDNVNHLDGNVRSIQKLVRKWQVLGRTE